MFTGIIEALGIVQAVQQGSNSAKLRISSPLILSDLKIGDSIAVNGICLTATTFDSSSFTVDVMPETMQKTNLGELKHGHKVNLERALTLSTRLGGHLVSGHIDTTGRITKLINQDIAIVFEIQHPPYLAKYLVPQGSIAIDGTSLTIVNVGPHTFSVSLIPHTRGLTTLGHKKAGDTVNLEADVIAKYLEKLLSHSEQNQPGQPTLRNPSPSAKDISMAFLAEKGFI